MYKRTCDTDSNSLVKKKTLVLTIKLEIQSSNYSLACVLYKNNSRLDFLLAAR